MLTIQQKSIHVHKSLVLLLALLAFATAFAVRPAAGQAAPTLPLAFEPASYDFGMQGVDWGTQQTNLQLRNNGSDPVSTENVELSGSGAFWTGYYDCAWRILQPNETCSIQVFFDPWELEEYAATLTVRAEGQAVNAALGGSGGAARFSAESELIDFGSAAVDSAGVTREIQLSNTGNMPGGLFIAVIAGGAIGSFQFLDENCTGFPLSPAATCSLQVRFRPLSEGVKTARIGLFGESDGGAQLLVTGVGTAPVESDARGAESAGTAGSVTSVVNTTTHRITRHVVRPKRKTHRSRGIRHHRRSGLKAAKRIATPSLKGYRD